MRVGDLVTMDNYCGGPPGGLRCETALVVNVELSHSEQIQIGSHTYMDRDINECTLMCKCGIFEEYEDNLGVVK
tara:strand:- start:224 stop:445 length:222 start_codon:yes stop_codon:yes gene_type:complete